MLTLHYLLFRGGHPIVQIWTETFDEITPFRKHEQTLKIDKHWKSDVSYREKLAGVELWAKVLDKVILLLRKFIVPFRHLHNEKYMTNPRIVALSDTLIMLIPSIAAFIFWVNTQSTCTL
jgi:hypothetical protein